MQLPCATVNSQQILKNFPQFYYTQSTVCFSTVNHVSACKRR